MNIGGDIVTPTRGPRPAGKPDECFYCRKKLGEKHRSDCVIIQKSVVVKMTLEVIIDVPRSWEKDSIEFRMNESSWCASSIIRDLNAWEARVDAEAEYAPSGSGRIGECLCPAFEGEFIRDATEEDHQKLPVLIDVEDLKP